jgi:hypothetical protein
MAFKGSREKMSVKINCAKDWWLVKLSSGGRVSYIEEHLPHLLHINNLDTTTDLTDEQIVFIYESATKK